MADENVRVVIEGDASDLRSALRGAAADMRGFGSTVSSEGRRASVYSGILDQQARNLQAIGQWSRYAAGGLALVAGAGLAKAVKDGIAFNATMESNELALKNLVGGSKEAKKYLDELYDTAKETPFEFTDLTSASRRLISFGLDAEKTQRILAATGDAVAAMGGSAENIDRVTLALGQMQAKGKVSAEELLQLTEAGIPAYKILQDELGLTGDQVANIGNEGIKAGVAIDALTRGMEKRFGGMAAKQAQTWSGMTSTMRDTWAQMTGAMTEDLFDELKHWAPTVLDTMDEVTRIFNRKDLSFEEKFNRSIETVELNLGPLADEIESGLHDLDLPRRFADLLDEAIPVIAEGFGDLAWTAVKSFTSAFVNADPWTQLVMGSWLITKIGGGAAWIAIGQKLGGLIGIGTTRALATTVATDVATSAAGTALGDAVGASAGNAAGAGFKRTAGGVIVPAAAEVGAEAATSSSTSMAKGIGGSLLRGGLIGGAIYGGFQALFTNGGIVDDFKEWFGMAGDEAAQTWADAFLERGRPAAEDAISQIAQGMKAQAPDLQAIVKDSFGPLAETGFVDLPSIDFTGGRGQKLDAIQQQVRDVRELTESMGDLTAEQEEAFDALEQNAEEAADKFHASVSDIKQGIDYFSDGTGASLRDINTQIKKVSGQIAETLGSDSARGRRQLGKNYREAIQNIRESMDRAEIGTKRGLKRIRELMREARLVDPGKKDPFRIAEGFADSWKQAGKINRKGLQDLKDDLAKMPKDARDSAADAMIDMARSLEDKSKLPKGSTRKLVSYLQSQFTDLNTGPKGIPGIVADLTGAAGDTFDNFGTTVHDTLGGVLDDLNEKLKQMGLDPVGFDAKGANTGAGRPNRKQRGGHISEGAPNGDSVPALLERDEYVLNREAVKRIGVSELDRVNFGLAPRFQEGGLIQQALGPYDMPPIAYDANHAGGNSHLHLDFFTVDQALAYGHKMQQMGWSIDEYTPKGGNPWGFGGITTHHESPGHYDGTAFDANTASDETRAEVEAVVRMLGGAAISTAAAQRLAKQVLEGPDGPITDFGQAVLDKAVGGANKYLEEHAPTDTGGMAGYISGGDGAVAAQIGSILLRQGFDRAAAAGIIGNAYRESLWNPASVGTGGGGLWGFTTSPISLADLQNFAKQQGRPWTDVGLQTQFMLMHGGLGMRGALNALTSPEQTAELFMTDWERPGIPALSERQAAARRAFEMTSWQKGGLVDLKGSIHNMFGAKSGDRREQITHRMQKDLKDLASEGLPIGNNEQTAGRLKSLRALADKFGDYATAASSMTDDADGAAPGAIGLGGVKGITAGERSNLGLDALLNGKELVEGSEMFWKVKQLEALFKLRNLLIKAEKRIDARRRYAMKLLDAAKTQAKEWSKKQRRAQHDLDKDGKTPKDWKGADPSKDAAAEWNKLGDSKRAEIRAKFEKQGGLLPGDRKWGENNMLLTLEKNPEAFPNLQGIRSVLTLLNETVLGDGGIQSQISSLSSARGTVLSELHDVQGEPIAHGHDRLRKLPPLGTLFGEIFDVQDALHDYGVATDISDDSTDSDRADLAEQLLLQSQQENRLLSAGYGVFEGFFAELRQNMPFVGTYDHGGYIGKTGYAKVHAGEWITPAPDGPFSNQAAAAAAAAPVQPVIELTFADNSGQLVKLIDARVDGRAVQVVDKKLGRAGRQRAVAPGR